jgi:hypothetical protein
MAALHRPAISTPRVFGKGSAKFVVYGAIAVVVAAAIFQVNRFSTLTSRGYEINDLQRQRAERQAVNHQLEADVASLSSLARVDIEARARLKLQPATQKMYITVHGDVPQRQSLPTRFLTDMAPPAAAPAPASGQPLWRRVLGILPGF